MLFLYVAVSDHATSFVLVREEEEVQYLIYYTSKVLLDAETRYPPLEKLVLALVVAARKLRPYFQAFLVSVITNQPLRQTLYKLDASSRLVKWAIELSEFDIDYKPRADILARMTAIADPKMHKSIHLEVKTSPSIEQNLVVMRIKHKYSWMDLIISYIRDRVLPPDKLQARKIRAQALRYTMIDGLLYRRRYTLPLLQCLDEDNADYILR